MSQYRTQDWITNIPLYAVNKLYGSAYIQVQKAFEEYSIFAGFPELVNIKQKRQ